MAWDTETEKPPQVQTTFVNSDMTDPRPATQTDERTSTTLDRVAPEDSMTDHPTKLLTLLDLPVDILQGIFQTVFASLRPA